MRVRIPPWAPKIERLTYAEAKGRKVEAWKKRTLVHILRFPPGYRKTGVFSNGPWQSGKPKWEGEELDAEEALYVWESFGEDPYNKCREPERFIELIERKDGMNLTISMWKETIRDFAKDGPLGKWANLQTLLDIEEDNPVEWMEQIGLFKLVDILWIDYKILTIRRRQKGL